MFSGIFFILWTIIFTIVTSFFMNHYLFMIGQGVVAFLELIFILTLFTGTCQAIMLLLSLGYLLLNMMLYINRRDNKFIANPFLQ